MNKVEVSHAIAEQLMKRKNAVLVGQHGLGRRETLAEVQALLPQDMPCLKLDFERWQVSDKSKFENFLSQTQHAVCILHNMESFVQQVILYKLINHPYINSLEVYEEAPHEPIILFKIRAKVFELASKRSN